MAVFPREKFSVLRNVVSKDETKALQMACEKLQTSERYLKANHNEKSFVFEKIR